MGRSRASLSQSSRLTDTGAPHRFGDAKSRPTQHPRSRHRCSPSSLRKQGSRSEQSDSCFRRG